MSAPRLDPGRPNDAHGNGHGGSGYPIEIGRWRKRGHDLGLGVGIAQGCVTIGAIGFEGRWDYGAIGNVTNLSARLCGEAQPGQILLSASVASGVEDLIETEEIGPLTLKGFSRPMPAFNLLRLKALK